MVMNLSINSPWIALVLGDYRCSVRVDCGAVRVDCCARRGWVLPRKRGATALAFGVKTRGPGRTGGPRYGTQRRAPSPAPSRRRPVVRPRDLVKTILVNGTSAARLT